MPEKDIFINDAAFALSSPTRVEILRLLKDRGNVSNKDLSVFLRSNPANISQHLKVLKHTNLIQASKKLKDNTILLSIVPGSIKKLKQGLDFLFN